MGQLAIIKAPLKGVGVRMREWRQDQARDQVYELFVYGVRSELKGQVEYG